VRRAFGVAPAPAALLAVLLALAPSGAAAGARERATLPEIENEVMCVVCRVPLSIADAPEADRERAFIRGLIARGQTKSQIERALVAQYGPRVLATPSDHGVDLLAWIIPGALILAALGGVALVLPRWRRRRAAEPAPAIGAPLDSAESRRLDDELARFDG
jgi:cytochrome c-type biogenesis protein CcmH